MKKNYILLMILSVAFLLRVINLETVPNGLFSDESSFLINSVALKNSLRDEDNQLLPLYLRSIKDPKPALYSYLQIPFLSVFGVSTASSRLPSALLGVLSIYCVYLLTLKMALGRKTASIVSLVLALSPWHIMISRSTQEIILSFTLTVISLILFQDLLNETGGFRKKLVLFSVFNVLAMYTYHSAKIFLLVYALTLLGVKLTQNRSKKVVRNVILISLAVLVPLAITVSGAAARFKAVGLLNSDLPQAQINDFIANTTGKTPGILLRVFYNKAVFYARYFLTQYFDHFTGNFWFINGGRTGSQTIPAHGMFYIPDALLLLIGLVHFVRLRKVSQVQLQWVIMLLVSPIAAALTTEDIPSNTRSFFLVLPLAFFIGVGLTQLIQWRQSLLKNTMLSVLGLFYLWSIGYFVQQYYIQGPLWHTWYRSRDYEIAAQAVAAEYPHFNNIIVTNDLREMYIYLWLHGLVRLEDIQHQPQARYQGEYSLGNITFNNKICDFSQADNQTLIVGMPECKQRYPQALYLKKLLYFDDHMTPAMGLYQIASATQSAVVVK